MTDDVQVKEVEADRKKVKKASMVFYEDQILIECPFCGKTLIRTNYERVQKLLHIEGTPRAKQCPKCNGLAVLVLSSQARRIIKAKIAGEKLPT